MTISLYWKVKTPATQRLPIKLKWALESSGHRQIPSLDWLEGFVASYTDGDECEQMRALVSMLREMRAGVEIELEWQ